MSRILTVAIAAALLSLPGISQAQTAQEIIDKARDKQLARWEGVNCFAKTETVMGQRVTTYYAKTRVEASNGESQTVFLQGTSCDPGTGQSGNQSMTPEQMEAYAEGLDMTGSALSEGVGDGLENAGMPRDLLKSMGGDPWVSPDPGTMMGGMGEFMRGSAEGQREMARERQADAEESAEGFVAFRDRATLVGTETVDGRKAWQLRVEDLGQVEKLENGQELELNTVNVWIDSNDYVTLKTRIDGVMTERGEQRPVVMEQSSTDFRAVPGSDMYEPYRQTMTMSGMLSEEDKAQMAEAKEQLAEAERQIASMPPDQRAMVEQMMGGQMDMLRNMVNGGGFTMETVVDEIIVNPEPGAMMNRGVMPSVASASPAPGGDDVLRMVQENLAALGYETGNTDGIESTETTIAISQFQAAEGMEVTGKPSPQLAGILAAKTSGSGSSAAGSSADDAAALEAARQECLKNKIAEAEEAKKKKKGFGKLLGSVARTTARYATGDFSSDVARVTNEVYKADATAKDMADAAEALGLSEDDIAACQNPG